MATCKQTAYELIQDTFSPCVAVMCSSDVEQICAKNNLTFVEMVQPFCRLSTEATIRDPSNMPCAIKNFRVVMKDLHSQPPVLSVGKKMMHDAVSSNVIPANDGILMNTLKTENYLIKYSSSTPWFEAYREVFFQVTTPTEHEFLHNYLSCVFVVSSSHQDPLSQINELSQQFIQHQQNSLHNSKWFFSYVYTYYLLLHDVSSEDLAKAEAVYQSMKSSFGSASCHLLQINSATQSAQSTNAEEPNGTIMPDPWSQFLPKYCVQNDISNSHTNEEKSYDAINNDDKSGDVIVNSKESDTIHHPLLFNSDGALHADSLTNSCEEVDTASSFTNKFLKSSKQKRHGVCLTLSDMDRIKCFVQDFCIQGLIPFVEKQIRILSDQVANRKGIHRTLFGVTKKFFGNKPGAQNPASALNSVVYGPDAPELQVRKLGDLAFMFQLYEVAYQAYHNAKRDFNADQAWLHFAGASEMAALSVFMQNSTLHEYPARYIESAITTYLLTCKLPELATRATFLSSECLKAKGLYRDAAAQFIRMPSEADLPSALCLEQAAYCYINCKPPKIRKYAFHIILAGHRFSKAGQKKHALRSYKQAQQVYSAVGWNFANNHINFTIGRLSLQLDQLESACAAFEPLLISKCQLPPVEQANYLREYLYVLKRLNSQNSEKTLPILPVPLIESDATKVLLSEDTILSESGPIIVKGRGFDRGDLNNLVWSKLEEIVTSRVINLPLFTSQLQCFTSKTNNVLKPNAIIGEVLSLEITLRNPLSVILTIDNVFPLWTFIPQSQDGVECAPISNETENNNALTNAAVLTKILARVTLDPHQEKKVHLLLTPQQVGELSIKGIAYNLLCLKQVDGDQVPDALNSSAIISLQGKQCLKMKGPRLNKTAEDRATVIYADDNRLNINILDPMAKLQAKFQKVPFTLFCGEIQKVTAEFTNVGQHQLRRIIMASPTPGIFAVGSPGETNDPHTLFKEISSSRQPSPVIAEWKSDWLIEILMPDGEPCVLDPGQSIEVPVWFKGPEIPGDHDLDILFYYESYPVHPKLKYRLLQLSTVLITHPSVNFNASAMRSFCSEEKSFNFHPAAIPTSLIISAEIGNISQQLSQVSLVQISCISKNWCFLSSEENCCKGLSVIRPDETFLLNLKAIGFDPKCTVSSQEVKVFSHIPLGRVAVDSSSTPCSDFSQKSGLNLRSILPAECEPKHIPSVKECDELKMESDMILLLVIIWKAKVHNDGKEVIVTGQHHVPILSLSASSTIVVKTPSSDIPEVIPFPLPEEIDQTMQSNVPSELTTTSMVKCSLNHPFHIQHDFSSKRFTVVPVGLVIRSTCDVELCIIIDNSSHNESVVGQNNEENSVVSQMFSWVCGSKREFLVKSHSTIQVPLQALFCAPGTYNLSNLNIVVQRGKDFVSVYQLPPHLIIINSCNAT